MSYISKTVWYPVYTGYSVECCLSRKQYRAMVCIGFSEGDPSIFFRALLVPYIICTRQIAGQYLQQHQSFSLHEYSILMAISMLCIGFSEGDPSIFFRSLLVPCIICTRQIAGQCLHQHQSQIIVFAPLIQYFDGDISIVHKSAGPQLLLLMLGDQASEPFA